MTNGNGAPPEQAPPQLNVLAQYTKDLSFENPNAPSSLAPQQQQPAINIQINVSANNLSDNEFEVTLSIEGKAENAGKVMFSFERLCRRVPHRQRAQGKPASAGHDRMPSAVVPVRARDHRDRSPRRWFPAADAGSGRFRRPVPPESGAAGRGPSRAGKTELSGWLSRRPEIRSRSACRPMWR